MRILMMLLVISILLIPVLPVLAADVTNVALSISSGPPGTTVTITGSGFTATTYSVTFGSVTVISSGTISGGNLSDTFSVPILPRRLTPYSVVVNAPPDTVNTTTFTITSRIFASDSSGKVGDEVGISGNGFAASSTVTIYFDSTSLTSVSSNSSGIIPETDITIPQARAGWHTISAQDYLGTSSSVSFIVSPRIVLSSSTVSAGSTFSCSGNGFAYSSDISFYLDDDLMDEETTTNSIGTFSSVTLTLPVVSGGTHVLKARDQSGNYATANISVSAALTISPNTGPAGTDVSITGNGFKTNTNITITYDGSTVSTSPSPAKTDGDGKFTASFKTPAGPSGVHTVTAKDGTNTATTYFSSSSTAAISTTTGTVDAEVSISGAGFKANATIIVTYDGVQVGLDTTDASGNFTTTFQTPPSFTGAHLIVVTDQTNTKQFTITVSPVAGIEPVEGFVGSDVNITGNGFGSQDAVTVKYDGSQVAVSSTDRNGTFTASFKAPVSTAGDHVITVSDGNNTMTLTFTMDSTAPPAPELLLPLPLTKAEKELTFSWQEVTDPSGVVYSLEIATDETFALLVLEKQDLTETYYTLGEEEELESVSKKTPYYWRVQAIDAASNKSEWSTPSTFYVGLVFPSWLIYVLFGVGALLLGVGGFFLGILWSRRRY